MIAAFPNSPFHFAAASSALVYETFEGPGAIETWNTPAGTAWDDAYATSPAPLAGSYSARVYSNGTNAVNAAVDFTGSANVYIRFRWMSRAVSAGNGILATVRDASGNILLNVGLTNAANRLRCIPTGGTLYNTVDAPTADVSYWVHVEFEKGSGSDAVGRVGFSASSARPSWPTVGASGSLAVSINGTSTADSARFMFGRVEAVINYDVLVDDIEIQNTPFA